MKLGLRLLLFILAFQMEVRVRASADVLEHPSQCLAKAQSSCAIQAQGEGFHLVTNRVSLHATKGSTLLRHSPDQWRLIQGNLWVDKGKSLRIETLFGEIASEQGSFWVLEKGNKVWIRNISSSLKVTLRDGKVLDLPEGFEFWISGLNSRGVSEYGMLQPIDIKEHLVLWSSLYQGSKEDFVKEVSHLKANWGDLAEKSSSIYKSLVMRELASEEEKRAALQRQKEQKEFELRRMKDAFRARAFER